MHSNWQSRSPITHTGTYRSKQFVSTESFEPVLMPTNHSAYAHTTFKSASNRFTKNDFIDNELIENADYYREGDHKGYIESEDVYRSQDVSKTDLDKRLNDAQDSPDYLYPESNLSTPYIKSAQYRCAMSDSVSDSMDTLETQFNEEFDNNLLDQQIVTDTAEINKTNTNSIMNDNYSNSEKTPRDGSVNDYSTPLDDIMQLDLPKNIDYNLEISERVFMSALLRHTVIALAIIVPLAIYSSMSYGQTTSTPTVLQTSVTNTNSNIMLNISEKEKTLGVKVPANIHYVANKALPTAIDTVDLNQYAGKWYEIARLPMYFQRKCVSDVTATYTLLKDNKGDLDGVGVLNECIKTNGTAIDAEGIAKPAGNSGSELKVTFLPRFLRWLPFGKADYWVIALEEGYNSALVGTPDKDYLWVLSRRPTLSKQTFDAYKYIATQQGYDLTELQVTPHSGTSSTISYSN